MNHEEINKDDRRFYTLREEKPAKAVLKMGIPVTNRLKKWDQQGMML